MIDYTDPNLSVQLCNFEAEIEKAHIPIKFPCSCYVEWNTVDEKNKITTQTQTNSNN